MAQMTEQKKITKNTGHRGAAGKAGMRIYKKIGFSNFDQIMI